MNWRERKPFAPPALRRLPYPGLVRQSVKKATFLRFNRVPARQSAPFLAWSVLSGRFEYRLTFLATTKTVAVKFLSISVGDAPSRA
jgi:hypothetical protein